MPSATSSLNSLCRSLFAFTAMIALFQNLEIVKADLTPKQKGEILATFNRARSTTVVPAANMKTLVWDEGIAQQMQNFTNGCDMFAWKVFKNPPCYFGYRDSAADPVGVAHWRTLRNSPFYDYETGNCINTTQSNAQCRIPEIYERFVVADIERVGCGMTRCAKGPGAPKGVIHACGIGNIANPTPQYPWIRGDRCSKCPSGWPYCVDGLCSKIPATFKPTRSPTVSRPSATPTKFPTRRPKAAAGSVTKAPTRRRRRG